MNSLRPIDLTFGALFVCLMAIGANITVWFPILAIPIGGTAVPLSLQTFFAILAGLILGRTLGSLSIITYVLVGIVGVPVFAGMKAGPMMIISPTGGFILSFILVAFCVGAIVERRSNPSFQTYLVSSIIGLIVNYGFGVTYMYTAMNGWLNLPVTYGFAWMSMIPFLIKDLTLGFLAAVFMIRVAKLIPNHKQRVKVS